MKLEQLPGDVHLTYCTNIHAGECWEDIRASLDEHVPAIKSAVAPNQSMGLGLRLSGQAAASARHPEAIASFREQLATLGAYVFTINAFPYGPFHGARVKKNVYLPDWRDRERVAFTANSAAVLAAVLPDGMDGSISTVPGAFKPNGRSGEAITAMTANLMMAVADLVDVERRTGKRLALALEPEPCCYLETTDETIAFFKDQLFTAYAQDTLVKLTGASRKEAEVLLRRHLGVCYDVCHGAVEYEDIVAALDRLLAAGIEMPKIQLSAAMRVPDMREDLVGAVMKFNDGVYLHQSIVRRDGGLARYVDLTDAVGAFDEGAADGEWRIHCHVPVFLGDLGEIGSTRRDLVATLAALRQKSRSSHLEVETYTWDVLPEQLRGGSKSVAIAREIAFCKRELVG
ncbi:metabolite traffic protein EboE [Bradyrhizobium diazoefficiens]|nr:metabolite traffic protein EboE [Bradyrhizobium diazoefficiens]MBR0774212.1 metabolite traffic protein EboE [Bradyrhizobium diazoefficiens]